MSRSGRGSTHPGRPAALPAGTYSLRDIRAPGHAGGLVVGFQGEDGRSYGFDIGSVPLPGWHQALAGAWASRIGPAGGLRTLASAQGSWGALGRLMRFLEQRPRPPASPARLTAADVQAFHRHLQGRRKSNVWPEVRLIALIMESRPLRDLLAQDVLDFLGQRRQPDRGGGRPGYSDGEFRRLVSAARADTANIRNRIHAGERLLARWNSEPDEVTGPERDLAGWLAKAAAAGEVPILPGIAAPGQMTARIELAGHLFVTRQDLLPLMLLLVALTGLNAESVKELPAAHRILEGQAVELRLVKRRHGERRWHSTVTWEIGPPGRELHTPGGLYLLLHRLMVRSRAVSGSASLWSVWRNGNRQPVYGADEHYDPFVRRLDTDIARQGEWAARHGLRADGDPPGPPLHVSLPRLRTTVQVRRTKRLGGHLPSAAQTNTIPVLFRNYLRGDPTATDWAHEVVSEAVVDAEQAMLAAHRRALQVRGESLRVISGPERSTGQRPVPEDAAWTACENPAEHPATGKPCQASFLDCFHCGNCLITRDHLPRLLALLEELTTRRQQLSEAGWWARYGAAWAAIRHDVLTKFTPAEINDARSAQPAGAFLDLVEAPWERP